MPTPGSKPVSPSAAPPTKPVPTPPPAQIKDRPVEYNEVSVAVCIGDDAITVEQAKEMLGWRETTDKDYLLMANGRKIACDNNVKNRPLYGTTIEALVQEHLKRKWKFNGEPIIIGKTKLILNGQHTLISLILAEEERVGKQKNYWELYWKTPVTMEKVVIFGVEEDDNTVNTMDTCKPRSFADVIYRSDYFKKVDAGERKLLSRMMEYAVKYLWHRTGADKDAFAPRRTHAEGIDFVNRHPRVERAVKHIFEENQKGALGRYVSPGIAAGLLYLMGATKSDIDVYANADPRDEKVIDWEYWEKACEFWVALAQGTPDVKAVREAIGLLVDPTTNKSGSLQEKSAILAKAWAVFKDLPEGAGQKVEPEDVKLRYHKDDDVVKLLDDVDFGGIDQGEPGEKMDTESSSPRTPEQIEAEKARVKEERIKALKERNEKRKAEKEAAKAAKTGGTPTGTPPLGPSSVVTPPLVPAPGGTATPAKGPATAAKKPVTSPASVQSNTPSSTAAVSGGAKVDGDPSNGSGAASGTPATPKKAPKRSAVKPAVK